MIELLADMFFLTFLGKTKGSFVIFFVAENGKKGENNQNEFLARLTLAGKVIN